MCCVLAWSRPLLLLPALLGCLYFFSSVITSIGPSQTALFIFPNRKKDASWYHTWDSSHHTFQEQDKVFFPGILRDHWSLHEAAVGFVGTAIHICSLSCVLHRTISIIHLLLSDIAFCEKEVYWFTNPVLDKITFLICPWCMWNRQLIPNFFSWIHNGLVMITCCKMEGFILELHFISLLYHL